MLTAKDLSQLAHTLAFAHPSTFVRRVYGRHHHESYLTEKAVKMAKDPILWLLSLDNYHLGTVADVLNRYANGYYIDDEEDNNG